MNPDLFNALLNYNNAMKAFQPMQSQQQNVSQQQPQQQQMLPQMQTAPIQQQMALSNYSPQNLSTMPNMGDQDATNGMGGQQIMDAINKQKQAQNQNSSDSGGGGGMGGFNPMSMLGGLMG